MLTPSSSTIWNFQTTSKSLLLIYATFKHQAPGSGTKQ